MKISVVIPLFRPNYNFLYNLISSIKCQDYKDYEVIFSDDEDCEKLLLKCIKELNFEKFTYIKNIKNKKGIFSNLNNAINYSNCELVQILCQDDFIKPKYFSTQVNTINKYENVGLVFSQFDLIDENNDLIKSKYLDHLNRLDEFLNKELLAIYFFFYGCFIGNISPVMIKRKTIERIGLFNEDFLFASDFEYWVRICNIYNIVFNKTNYLNVRNHRERASVTLPSITLLRERKIIYKSLFKNITNFNLFLKYFFINYEIGSWNLFYTIRKRELNKKTIK